jgi:heavy metal translocating P-type ATPase
MSEASQSAADSEPGVRADARALQRAWLRIGIGVAVAGQAMVFSLAVNLTPAEGAAYWLVHGGLLASALLALVFLGRDLVGAAWSAVRERRVSIDLLFLVTLLGALGGSITSTVTGAGSVYYEVVAVLIVVHTLGKMAGARSRAAALRAADRVAEKFERCVVLRVDGGEERVAVATLRGGERVVVAPGAAICVDGVVEEGLSYVEEAAMTGEWRPVARGAGDAVWAGTHAVDGRLVIRVAAGPRRLDGVLRAVAEARLAPSVLQAQADRLMKWFLPVVTGVSAATFFGWWAAGAEWERALFNAMAVLLVACPCAMGLATPVAVWGGLARLARMGVVARSGDFLAALARVDTVCFDKTGTLSGERLAVRGWELAEAWREREGELRAAVAAVERGLPHPVARALAEPQNDAPADGQCNPIGYIARPADGRAGDSGLYNPEVLLPKVGGRVGADGQCNPIGYIVRELRVVAGRGVEARVEGLGLLRVGEAGFAGAEGAAGAGSGAEAAVGTGVAEEAGAGRTGKLVHVAVDGVAVARVELAEAWRIGLADTLEALRKLGMELEVLTGDGAAPAEVAGAPVRGGLTPEGKAARVRELAGRGRTVLFAGDGVNDAAAMSAAAASLALRGGSELARASAAAVCAGEDLRRLPEAVAVARRVVGGVRGNLLFAASYNAVGMALAAAGVLHPVAAALLMVGSSVLVGVRAMRSAEAAAVV